MTDFREATCRQYEENTCNRGGYCNFMHIKPISRCRRTGWGGGESTWFYGCTSVWPGKDLCGRYRTRSRRPSGQMPVFRPDQCTAPN